MAKIERPKRRYFTLIEDLCPEVKGKMTESQKQASKHARKMLKHYRKGVNEYIQYDFSKQVGNMVPIKHRETIGRFK